MNCPRCGAPDFRFACERCSLLTPAAAKALLDVTQAIEHARTLFSAAAVRVGLKRCGTFDPEDIEGILRAVRLAPLRPGGSFPLWDRLRANRATQPAELTFAASPPLGLDF